jgi:hypothetical protein
MPDRDQEMPAVAVPGRGRRLAGTVTASLLALLASAAFWIAAGHRAANDCRENGYGIPGADAVEMTDEGCRVQVAGEWSDPLPARNEGLALAALAAAGLACVPPYLHTLRRRELR